MNEETGASAFSSAADANGVSSYGRGKRSRDGNKNPVAQQQPKKSVLPPVTAFKQQFLSARNQLADTTDAAEEAH